VAVPLASIVAISPTLREADTGANVNVGAKTGVSLLVHDNIITAATNPIRKNLLFIYYAY
jgi:hypothetical protein